MGKNEINIYNLSAVRQITEDNFSKYHDFKIDKK